VRGLGSASREGASKGPHLDTTEGRLGPWMRRSKPAA
jgi:hypothetical protein